MSAGARPAASAIQATPAAKIVEPASLFLSSHRDVIHPLTRVNVATGPRRDGGTPETLTAQTLLGTVAVALRAAAGPRAAPSGE